VCRLCIELCVWCRYVDVCGVFCVRMLRCVARWPYLGSAAGRVVAGPRDQAAPVLDLPRGRVRGNARQKLGRRHPAAQHHQ